MRKKEEKTDRKERLIRQIKVDIICKIGGFAAAMIITFTCVFGLATAPDNDMYPAIHDGDLLIYYRLGSMINSDIILYETGRQTHIGRISASEGENLDRTEGGLLKINGNIQPVQKRSGLYYKTYVDDQGGLTFPSTIGAKEYLVLGDERKDARDSRDFGLISREQVKGKVFTVIRRRPL